MVLLYKVSKCDYIETIWDVVEDIYLLFKILIMILHEINFYSIGFLMVY